MKNIVQIGDKSYIKSQVVMLATNKANIDILKPYLWKGSITGQLHFKRSLWIDDTVLFQHLYFLSNEEVKEGDWFISHNNELLQCIKIEGNIIYDKQNFPSFIKTKYGLRQENKAGKNGPETFTLSKKVIATTDDKLGLPRPSNEFLQKYCELGGVEDVLIKVEEIKGDKGIIAIAFNEFDFKMRISSDNTITIKEAPKLSDQIVKAIEDYKISWSKEEVYKLVLKAWNLGARIGNADYEPCIFDKWVEENLK